MDAFDLEDRWVCTKCGHSNLITLDDVEEERCFICEQCGKRHYLDIVINFEVRKVLDADREDKAEEEQEMDLLLIRCYPCVKVSRDRGVTWAKERINTVEFDPTKNLTIKPGWWIETNLGTFEVCLHKGMLGTIQV